MGRGLTHVLAGKGLSVEGIMYRHVAPVHNSSLRLFFSWCYRYIKERYTGDD